MKKFNTVLDYLGTAVAFLAIVVNAGKYSTFSPYHNNGK